LTQRQLNRLLSFYHKSLRLLEDEFQREVTERIRPDERLTIAKGAEAVTQMAQSPEPPLVSIIKEHRQIVRMIFLLENCSETKEKNT
jgi:hypothetical protein